MRARDAVGRKIVRVDQTRIQLHGEQIWVFDRIVLDNGTVLYPVEVELDGDLATRLCAVKGK